MEAISFILLLLKSAVIYRYSEETENPQNKRNKTVIHCTSSLHGIDEFFHHVEPNHIQLSH